MCTARSGLRHRSSGFSVIELLVVVAILGVLLGIGYVSIPRDRFAVDQAAQGFAKDVQFARFQAVTRNTYVRVTADPVAEAYQLLDMATNVVIKAVEIGGDTRTGRAEIVSAGPAANDVVFDPRGIGIGIGPQVVVFGSTSTDHTRTVRLSQQGRTTIE